MKTGVIEKLNNLSHIFEYENVSNNNIKQLIFFIKNRIIEFNRFVDIFVSIDKRKDSNRMFENKKLILNAKIYVKNSINNHLKSSDKVPKIKPEDVSLLFRFLSSRGNIFCLTEPEILGLLNNISEIYRSKYQVYEALDAFEIRLKNEPKLNEAKKIILDENSDAQKVLFALYSLSNLKTPLEFFAGYKNEIDHIIDSVIKRTYTKYNLKPRQASKFLNVLYKLEINLNQDTILYMSRLIFNDKESEISDIALTLNSLRGMEIFFDNFESYSDFDFILKGASKVLENEKTIKSFHVPLVLNALQKFVSYSKNNENLSDEKNPGLQYLSGEVDESLKKYALYIIGNNNIDKGCFIVESAIAKVLNNPNSNSQDISLTLNATQKFGIILHDKDAVKTSIEKVFNDKYATGQALSLTLNAANKLEINLDSNIIFKATRKIITSNNTKSVNILFALKSLVGYISGGIVNLAETQSLIENNIDCFLIKDQGKKSVGIWEYNDEIKSILSSNLKLNHLLDSHNEKKDDFYQEVPSPVLNVVDKSVPIFVEEDDVVIYKPIPQRISEIDFIHKPIPQKVLDSVFI